jgi:hypothetical protein
MAEIILVCPIQMEAEPMQKVSFSVRIFLCVVVLFAFSLPVAGAAKIKVDSAHFDMGTIREGEKKSISHTFLIKNTGDDTLRIQKVKPG